MIICRAATTHRLETKSTTTNKTKGQTKAIKEFLCSTAMESRNKKDHTVELSPELVAMLEKRQRDWGTNSRGEVVEMLLGWLKKDSLR